MISIIDITSVDIISLEKKSIKYDSFEEIINQIMFPYFNIIPTNKRNVLQLQYKKVDNYLKYDNITAFIMNKSNMPRDEIIQKLSKWFRITLSDAEKEYEKREGEIVMEMEKGGDKKYFKTKTDGFVNITIKMLSPVDMEFEITGFKYFETYNRIIQLLKILINLTNMKINMEGIDINKLEKGLHEIKDDGNLIKLKDVEKDDIMENDIEPEYLDNDEKILYEEENGEIPVDNDMYKDFLDIVAEYKDAPEGEQQEDINIEEEVEGVGKHRAKFFFKQLKDADKDLFDYVRPKDKKNEKRSRKDYSTLCSGRYPIVINKQQKNIIDKNYPKSYENFLKIGTTPELAEKNIYICPKIWCPKSMISMTDEQFNSNNKKCPFEGEEPIYLKNSYWKEDSKRYIGVLDPYTHPKDFCLPCCFKHDITRGKKRENLDICKKRKPDLIYINEQHKEEVVQVEIIKEFDETIIGNPKYIKGEFNWPLHTGHYGLLPLSLINILGNKICGDRQDGTGNMQMDKDCYLRRGSTNKDQSFLACIVEILDNPDIQSIKDIYKLMNNITLERFISLENGKILKVFINENFSIFDKNNFIEFKDWFLNNKQYALKFNLGKIYRTLLSDVIQSFSINLRHYKDIIREFIIYNGYKHFIEYITSQNQKDHRILIDLINCEKEILNPKKINIIIIDISYGKLTVQCPFNRNNKESYNRNNPFAFIIWNGKYYEIISKVKYNKKYGIDTRYNFYYKNCDIEIKNLIDFVCNNCLDDTVVPEKQINDIVINSGLKPKYIVLDYNFKAKGILLSQNVYVPFLKSISIFSIVKKRFIYYSDLINYKCKINAKSIYTNLAKMNSFYKVKLSNDKYLLLEKDIIIPLNLKQEDVKYTIFEDDLEIFISHEREDERKSVISIVNKNKKMFSVFLNSVITYINMHEDIRYEIDFLTNFKNPFPMNFKRLKLSVLMNNIIEKVIVIPENQDAKDIINNSKEAVIPCPDLLWEKCLVGLPKDKVKEFVIKVSEQLLIDDSFYFDNRTKIFRHEITEFLFEHHDIIVGKHKDYIKRLQDPYKMLNEKLDEEFSEYIFTKNINIVDYIQLLIGPNPEFKNNYDKFKLILRNSFVIDVDKIYTNMYIYQLFESIYKTIHIGNIGVDSLYLKNIVNTYLINDYETDGLSELIQNKSFDFLWKEYKKKNKEVLLTMVKPPLNICIKFFGGAQYYPGLYELRILSEFVDVNILIFSRANKLNENGLEFINNRSANYILLYHKYDNKLNRDIYNLIVIDDIKRKSIFNKIELKTVINILKLKDIFVEIDVDAKDLLQAIE
jgi:hypothetical protein